VPANQHVLQLFDTTESLANTLTVFLCEGWEEGDWMLVAPKMRNWQSVHRRLRRRGFPIETAIEQGRLIVLDAALTRPVVIKGELPERECFFSTMGRLVARLSGVSSGRLRVCSEYVEILAEEGNFEGACRLEELWEEVRLQHPCMLLCSYSAAHFTASAAAEPLRRICRSHTRLRCESADILGKWLLRDGLSRFDAAG
jgi:hypothetical protein